MEEDQKSKSKIEKTVNEIDIEVIEENEKRAIDPSEFLKFVGIKKAEVAKFMSKVNMPKASNPYISAYKHPEMLEYDDELSIIFLDYVISENWFGLEHSNNTNLGYARVQEAFFHFIHEYEGLVSKGNV